MRQYVVSKADKGAERRQLLGAVHGRRPLEGGFDGGGGLRVVLPLLQAAQESERTHLPPHSPVPSPPPSPPSRETRQPEPPPQPPPQQPLRVLQERCKSFGTLPAPTREAPSLTARRAFGSSEMLIAPLMRQGSRCHSDAALMATPGVEVRLHSRTPSRKAPILSRCSSTQPGAPTSLPAQLIRGPSWRKVARLASTPASLSKPIATRLGDSNNADNDAFHEAGLDFDDSVPAHVIRTLRAVAERRHGRSAGTEDSSWLAREIILAYAKALRQDETWGRLMSFGRRKKVLALALLRGIESRSPAGDKAVGTPREATDGAAIKSTERRDGMASHSEPSSLAETVHKAVAGAVADERVLSGAGGARASDELDVSVPFAARRLEAEIAEIDTRFCRAPHTLRGSVRQAAKVAPESELDGHGRAWKAAKVAPKPELARFGAMNASPTHQEETSSTDCERHGERSLRVSEQGIPSMHGQTRAPSQRQLLAVRTSSRVEPAPYEPNGPYEPHAEEQGEDGASPLADLMSDDGPPIADVMRAPALLSPNMVGPARSSGMPSAPDAIRLKRRTQQPVAPSRFVHTSVAFSPSPARVQPHPAD